MIFNFRGRVYNLKKRADNWTQSSVASDKRELQAYQYFKNEFENIKSKSLEYIEEEGYSNKRLSVEFEGRDIPISLLSSLKDTYRHDSTLSVEERAIKVATLTNMYNRELKNLQNRIINMAVASPDNLYLVDIATSINILNDLLREYAYMQAIVKSGIKVIAGADAALKVKTLKDNIEIRISEINARLTLEEIQRRP